MNDPSRRSHIFGSINSTFYVDPNRPIDSRIIRVQGAKIHQSTNIQQSYGQQNFSQLIVISPYTAWTLLFISACSSSFVAPWLLHDVKSQGFTRNGWRSLITAFYILPFLLYQQRTNKQPSTSFLNQLTKQKLKPIFISTINFCIWLLCLIYACRHTSMNHSVFLCCLRFYSSTIVKMKRGERVHQFQIAGWLMCTLGVMLMLGDSVTLERVEPGPGVSRFLTVEPWKRLFFGDSLAIFASFVAVFLDQYHQVPDMPKFTYMYLYNMFLCINSIAFGYFFGGNEFSFNPNFGVFGLFTYENFVGVMYVSVLLGIWLLIVNVLIAQIFNSVIIDIASTFELIICCFIWNMLGLESFPNGMTMLGYAFLMPGLVFIISGRGVLQNVDSKINFQLYRPTQTNVSFRNTFRPTLKGSLLGSIQWQKEINLSAKPWQKDKQQRQNNMPFKIILQEDENQGRNNKYH